MNDPTIQINDEAALEDIDQRLEEQPDLRRLLRETAVGQSILKIVADAQAVLARASAPQTSVTVLADYPIAVQRHQVICEREVDLRASAGEVRVRLNGVLVWSEPFAIGHENAEEAEEGGKLFAQTLREALS